jgi:hypothetical protein
LPLFTELPTAKVLSETQREAVRARREDESPTTSTMIRAKTTTVTVAAICNAAFGASLSPGAADRMLVLKQLW